MSVSYGGDSITFADGSVTSSGHTGFRNRIINGAMTIDQRNAGANTTPTTTSFGVDRWNYATNVASKMKIGQNLNSVTPPNGFTNYLGVQTVSANTASSTNYYALYQSIEGTNIADLNLGSSSGSTFTVSFWVRSSLTGTFNVTASSQYGANATYASTYTINSADTWEYKSLTFPATSIGTWLKNTGLGMMLWWDLGSGTDYQGTGNTWANNYALRATGTTPIVATNNATFYITGVQLERGSTASSFDYRPYTTELQLCQRYYEIVRAGGTMFWSSGNVAGTGSFVVEKRAAPTVTRSTAYYAYPSAASFSASDITIRGFMVNSSGSYLAGDFEWTAAAEV